MDTVWAAIQDGLAIFFDIIKGFNPIVDLLDILIFAYLLYKLWNLIAETRAQQLLKGIVFLVAAYFLALQLNMHALSWLLGNVFAYGLIIIAIVFQPELRRVLERMGRSNIAAFGRSLTAEQAEKQTEQCLDSVCRACQSMGKTRTGALIVIERTTALGDIVTTGTTLDAEPSKDLICNIFFIKSPLHDGAMVIRQNRIYSAGCILPLTENSQLNSELGTRHRAALGMSEISDAVVVVVSEETGTISLAQNGEITRDLNIVTLRNALNKAIVGDGRAETKSGKLRRILRLKKKEDNDEQ